MPNVNGKKYPYTAAGKAAAAKAAAKKTPQYAKWSDLSPAEKAAQAARMSRKQGTTPQAYVKGKSMTAADKYMMKEATKGRGASGVGAMTKKELEVLKNATKKR